MDRRRAAGVLLALAACVAYATAAPTASNHTALDIYDGAPDGCYYNFQHYGEGDRIMTNEPCLNCTCHNRMLMCYLRVCPFTKPIGQDCTIEKRADQCCPIVTCPDVPVDLLTSTTTSPAEYGATGIGKLDKFGCSIHGKYFPEGAKVPPTPNKPCEHCYCIRNMTTCVMQECTLHVDGCTPIYHKDVCCPVRYSCDHPEDEMPLLDDLSTTVRPTPGFLLTTTTLSPVTQMSQDCLYENQVISDGALIKTEKACDHCYCMKGDIVCVVQECGTPMENEGKNCTALAPREGVCCPDTYICEGDEPTTGTYETDYTTDLEKLTTLSPPRRSESEGSGYRKETDGVPDADIPPTETETEGSGYDQATAHPTILTEAPESHKIDSSDGMLSSTTIKEPSSYETTENELQKDTESQYNIPSTTSAYISQQVDESLSTKAQDEDIGSGEEDIITPYEPAPSSAPDVEDHEPTVSSEQNAVTTDTSIITEFEIDVKATTIKTDISKEQSVTKDDNAIDDTTRHSLGEDEDVETSTLDDDYKITERDSVRTTNIPIVEEIEKKTTESPEQVKETLEPHRFATPTTSALGIEDDVATTEPQDTATESVDGTVPEFYDHHQITVTASTPLLEEIEKDTTDQEIIRDGSTPDLDKISTIASNIPTEESINKDSFMPDVIDETFATNIPTTVSTIEDDVRTTDDEQKTNYEDSSEPQQFIPTTIASVSGDGTESTLSIESITTKSQESQETDTSELTDQQHTSAASIPLLEDITKETTSSDDISNISKFDESPETNVEHSSEPQQHSSTTSGPRYDDESKETTEIGVKEDTGVKESSEPHEYDSTTSAAILDDETKISTLSDATSIKTPESQETSVEDSSEPQQYAPTTTSPLIDDENRETTSKTDDQEIKVADVSASQHVPTTSATLIEDETTISTSIALDSDTIKETLLTTNAPVFEIEKTTPSVDLTTSEAQEDQKLDVDNSSESNQNAPITSAPVFEDEIVKTTPPDALTTPKYQEVKETHVIDSSESNEYAATTNGAILEDESKLTTPTEYITTPKIQDIQDTHKYIPTTIASTFKEESKETTISNYEESSTLVPKFEDETKETSSAITDIQNEITTTEPDKGLNTIPSGSVEEETTESPGVAKHTDKDELIPIESATGHGNKLYDVTESILDTSDHITLETSTSSKDLLTQSTEPTVKDIIDSSTKTTDISELTTGIPIDVIEEELSMSTQYDRQPSTKQPATEYQESSTSSLPGDDSEKPYATSSYEHSPQTTSSQSSEESQTVTSSPSYSTISVSTAADLEENEISNESRIPGEGDCLLNGVTYRNESAVPSTNKCQSGCRCSSSIIKCDPIICSPPPEYMDNCQTTYDTPNSCCPTYVCDHKTETMPPQSHSQMSGTEAPVESPIKCAGDECVLNEGMKEPAATSQLCESGSCSEQAESTTVPKQPAVDRKAECTGSSCKSASGECSQENGCQPSPVLPCEGTECKDSSETIPPHEQQPCIGDSCDVPVIDCSTGKCDDENKLGIEKECTEKSCKRKGDSDLDQQPPTKCSGSECPLSETTSEIELSTVGTLDVKTEEIEESSKPSATEANLNLIDESEDRVTEALLESESTTGLPTESHKVPDQDSNKDEISTSYKPTTPSIHEESSVPDSTQTYDKMDTESQNIPSTDKVEYEVTSEAGEKHTLSIDDKSTENISAEITTATPKTQTAEQDEFTKMLLESEDITTLSSQGQQTTQPPEKHSEISTSVLEELTTKISITQEVDNVAMGTEQPVSSDSLPYDTTKFSVDRNEENTITYDSDDVTKLPQVSEEITTKASEVTTSNIYDSQDTTFSEDSTTQIADLEMSKPHSTSTDLQGTTEIPKDSQNEETSVKITDEFVAQTEISTTAPSRETITESSKPVDLEKTQEEQSPDTTQSEMTTITIKEDVKTESPKPSEADTPIVTESSDETYTKETTSGTDKEIDTQTIKPYDTDSQKTTLSFEKTETDESYTKETASGNDKEIDTQTIKPYDTESQKTTLSSEKTETVDATKMPTVTEPSLISETEEDIFTKSPVSGEFTRIDGASPTSETESPKGDEILHITVAPQQDGETDINKIEDADTESSKPSESEIISTTKSSLADSETQETTAKAEIGTDMESTKSDEMEPPQAVTQSAEYVSVPFLDGTTIQSAEEDQKLYSENTTPQPETVSELTTQSILVPDSKITETEGSDDKDIITRIQEPVTELATESVEKVTSTLSESSSVKEDDMTSIYHDEITTELSLDLTTMHVPHSDITVLPEKPKILDETTSSEIHLSTSSQTITEHPIEKDSETTTDIKGTTATVMDLTEDAETQVPDIVDTEKVSTTEQTTSKTSDTNDLSYSVDKKPQPTDPIDSHEEQPAEPSQITTESAVLETKLPVDTEIGQTDKPHKDESTSETPLTNEITTVMFEENITENLIDKEEEPEITQYHEIKPTESEEETYTKIPLPVSSDREDQIIDDEVTTDVIKSSEQTTESANLFTNAHTDSFSPINVVTEITQKEPLDTEITQQAETTTDIENLQVIETRTTVPDLSFEQESSTKEQVTSDTVKLTTEPPKHSYTEALDENATTAKPLFTETVTELVEVSKDEEEKTPEVEPKPSLSMTTASEEQMIEAQGHGDGDNVATEKGITTESEIAETTKAPATIETSTKLMDMITRPLEETVETSTPKHELSESTTLGKVEDEILHVEIEPTETSTTVSDQQTMGINTDLETVLIDTTTKKQDAEVDFIPSETERPEIYSTTLSAIEEPAKTTRLPIEEAATENDQPTISEPNASEEDKLTTNVTFDVEKASTPKSPEIEVQTEEVITPSERPIQPEASPVTTTTEEEKQTTIREEEKQTTAKAEEFTTAYPLFDKFTKTTHKPTDAPATEQPKPISTEEPSTDDILPPDEEPSAPSSGYGTDPDYMEEDQTFGPGTCRYGGKVYVSAQQIPRDDPCDFCFCFRSDIICLQQSCPPPIHGCHEEPISGFCCPRYECPVSMATTVNVTTTTTTTTTTLPPHFPVHSYKGSAQKRGCLIKGHTYKVGEVVRASSGPCLHCTCGGDGQMKCDPKQCTPEPMLRQMIAAAVSAKRRR